MKMCLDTQSYWLLFCWQILRRFSIRILFALIMWITLECICFKMFAFSWSGWWCHSISTIARVFALYIMRLYLFGQVHATVYDGSNISWIRGDAVYRFIVITYTQYERSRLVFFCVIFSFIKQWPFSFRSTWCWNDGFVFFFSSCH